ncbi:MAG: asparagine synthase (glutamine-hydrolyzing) [Thermosynechococcus sp.]|uniref:asparagine synthase (glutamine-hydrolyzing) n=1 Tax=Thermosynechococcus sp. TaxID=2814275 RepID=UPI0039191A5A
MCGIAGLWASDLNQQEISSIVERMANTLTHRGPDDGGIWVDETVGIALGHRRLAILDLSAAGHQPMVSASGRFVLVFNGEIYNHLEMRQQLEARGLAPSWRGHSDTETLLAAFEAWGIEKTLRKTVGMFALALWNRQDRQLTLARDRMGEKPLYYGWSRGAFVFGSELKAIRAYPGFDNPIERRALALYLRYNYIPAPWTIYAHLWKLPAGSWVQFAAEEITAHRQDRGAVMAYWSLREIAKTGLETPFNGSEPEAVEALEALLRQSIKGQMVADVPLGALLSGGIDSSTVVALMQTQSSQPIRTFTIGFYERAYNEAQHAKAIAQHLGTDHTEWYLTPKEALEVIPQLPWLYDEPFADSSQIPTHLVCRLARQQVTVALSGDGGDELFGGYPRYFLVVSLWRRLSSIPLPLRRVVARGIRALSPRTWNLLYRIIEPLLPRRWHQRLVGDKLHKGARLLPLSAPEEIYFQLVSLWPDLTAVVLGTQEPATLLRTPSEWLNCSSIEQRMMYLDALTYLPDDILVKVDRAAMGVSLETRAPLLDHRIVEFAWRLPLSMKIQGGQGKRVLRQVLYRYVPKQLVERPKMGFGVPIEDWLRGELRDWAEELLSEASLKRDGFLHPAPIRQVWQEHLSGQRNWQYRLWPVLMWQAWYRGMSAAC